MTACISVRRMFPMLRPKVLLRTDLWRHLDFTNKSHLSDKQIKLRWSREQLALLLLKRAIANDVVWEFVATEYPRLLEVKYVEDLNFEEVSEALSVIFPPSVYPGQNEARFVDWLVARVTDAQGTVLPREAVLLSNLATKIQADIGGAQDGGSLIGREAVREAFTQTSEIRCDTYLAEFPTLREHFRRFQGQTTANFERARLVDLMEGLSPNGTELFRELFEIGVILPLRGDVTTAENFEIPRLYRIGLGLIIRGRA